jgi:hypothetical protein
MAFYANGADCARSERIGIPVVVVPDEGIAQSWPWIGSGGGEFGIESSLFIEKGISNIHESIRA